MSVRQMDVRATSRHVYPGAIIWVGRYEAWAIVHAIDGKTLTFRYEDDRTNTLYTVTL